MLSTTELLKMAMMIIMTTTTTTSVDNVIYLDLFDRFVEIHDDLVADDGGRQVEAEPAFPVVVPVLQQLQVHRDVGGVRHRQCQHHHHSHQLSHPVRIRAGLR